MRLVLAYLVNHLDSEFASIYRRLFGKLSNCANEQEGNVKLWYKKLVTLPLTQLHKD